MIMIVAVALLHVRHGCNSSWMICFNLCYDLRGGSYVLCFTVEKNEAPKGICSKQVMEPRVKE